MMDEASYNDFQNISFDRDHEGRGGWTSGQILEDIDNWVAQTGAPDIVLFSSPGGNDILDQVVPYNEIIANVNAIIDVLQSSNPNIIIVIEQIAPGRSDLMTDELAQAFTNMQEDVVEIAAAQTTATSSVITVDMFTGFTDALLADDVHYNEAGALFIANRYYQVLENILEN